MVSTLDSESKDPRSSLGGTCCKSFFLQDIILYYWIPNQSEREIKQEIEKEKMILFTNQKRKILNNLKYSIFVHFAK